MGAFRRRNEGTTNYIPEATAIVAGMSSLSFNAIGQAIPVTSRVVDQRGRDLLSQPAVTVTSLDPSIASVSGSVVTSVAVGSTTIRLTSGSIITDIPLTVVIAQVLDNLELVISDPAIEVGDAAPGLTLYAWQDAGRTSAYTDSLSPAPVYSGDNNAVATIDPTTGVITMVGGAGVVTFSVTAGGKTASVGLTVSVPVPVLSSISPTSVTQGATGLTVTLTGTNIDGNVEPVFSNPGFSWTGESRTTTTLTLTGFAVSGAAATGAGTVKLHSTTSGDSGTQPLTVNAAASGGTPTTVAVSPSSFSVTAGSTQQLTASTQDNVGATMTGRTYAWSSSNTSVATVSSTGVVTGVATGTATIQATDTGAALVGSASATVTAASGAPDIASDSTVILNSDAAFAAATQKSDLIQEAGDPNANVLWPYGQHTDNFGRFVSNFDGSGRNAIALQFTQWVHTTLSTGFTHTGAAQTITVASTSGMVATGDHNLVIDPHGPNSEEILVGNWSVVDGTHLSVICTKDHVAGEVLGLEEEHDPELNTVIPAPTNRGAYFRMRMHAGRTAQDTLGIGVVPAPGDNSQITYFNPADLRFTGDKRFLLERDAGAVQDDGRIYLIFAFDPTSPTGTPTGLHLSSDGINLSRTVNLNSFDPDTLWGKDVEYVVYFKPATSGHANRDTQGGNTSSADGIIRVWINGVQLMEYTDLPVGTDPVKALQFPATFRTPKYDVTEYYTGVHAWIPVPATSAVPGNPTVGLASSATSDSITYPVTAAATGELPYEVYAEVDENGTGTWVKQPNIYWSGALGSTQQVPVSGLTASKNYAGKIRFTLHDSTGDSGHAVVTDGTTAAPPAAFSDAAFDFRATAGYVTDPTSPYTPAAMLGAANPVDVYPKTKTINGVSLICGWDSAPASLVTRDRQTSADPRIAGFHRNEANDGTTARTFRVDLPSPGTYAVHLCFYDSLQGNPGGVTLKILDGTTVLTTIVPAATNGFAAGDANLLFAYDATGAARDPATFFSTEQPFNAVMTGTVFRLQLGPATANCYINYLRLVKIS